VGLALWWHEYLYLVENIRFAAPSALSCHPCSRNSRAQKPRPDRSNLWCLNHGRAATALFRLYFSKDSAEVGLELRLAAGGRLAGDRLLQVGVHALVWIEL
jgi:hypothetical protein